MTWRNRKSFPSIIKFNDYYKNHQQHPYCVSSIGPKSCGRPEQPANGTLLAENFNVGNRVEYRCDPGHMAVGPTVRTCLSSGFYSEYPPVCKCKNYLSYIAQLSSSILLNSRCPMWSTGSYCQWWLQVGQRFAPLP